MAKKELITKQEKILVLGIIVIVILGVLIGSIIKPANPEGFGRSLGWIGFAWVLCWIFFIRKKKKK